jgi:UDP-glucose 4-epimerase
MLKERGFAYRAAVRAAPADGEVAVGSINGATEWEAALADCSAVIHLAARVHVMSDTSDDPLREYREVNVEGTLRLARQAVRAGVKRFIFVSSVKVNGESTDIRPFRADDAPAPCDPYGVSKKEAEAALLALGRETGLEVVIVRPPLIYGPGVKANFLSLVRLVQRGIPLPFGRVQGYRSMVALDNLVDLLITCVQHPNAPGHVFMVSDDKDVTVGDLVRMIGTAMAKNVLLVPVPPGLMRAAARLLRKSAVTDRLFGSLQVDISATKERLGWQPLVTPQYAVGQTVNYFLRTKGSNT